MMNVENAPLAGVRIADFTIHAAGPFCTHLLAQLGAECIKIESNSRLDAFRKPHAVYGRMMAATFDQVASNKYSIRLNLKKPEAVEIAKKLVSISDVATESFRPGVLKRLGLSFQELRDVKPDIVMMSLSACGQTGPDAHFAGYAPLFGAWGGLGTLTGHADGPPVEMRHVMDHSAGLHAALATIAALHQRQRTGQAQHVDIAAREVASAMIGEALVMASLGVDVPRPGNHDTVMAPHGVYATNKDDRWLTLSIGNDREWMSFLNVLGKDNNDPRMTTCAVRHQNQDLVEDTVQQWLIVHDADAIATMLQDVGVCAHVSWDMNDIATDKHLRERGSVVEVNDSNIPNRMAVGAPVRFSGTSNVGLRRLTPALGQDEDYVFGDLLGITKDQRNDLESREVIY